MDELHVEATGETVGEAKWNALRDLERLRPGLDRSAVRLDVLSEGERGLLGVGYAPARVVATVSGGEVATPPGRPGETSAAARVREILERITGAIGVHCRIDVDDRGETIAASCSGRDLGMLIGKHGQTIDAIQYLVNAIVAKGAEGERPEVVVDAAGYRARRQATLESLAVRSAERAVSTGARVDLDPMTAVERKAIHVRLKDYPGVATASEGTEPNRYVVITPAE
jgi:spoIIIJ-associated protein